MRISRSLALGLGAALLVPLAAAPALAQDADPAQVGRWSEPFAEPTINGQETDEVCIDEAQDGDEHPGQTKTCKVTATSLAVLGQDDVVYWNGLEDTEEVQNGIAFEYGSLTINTQVRRLDLASRTWTTTDPDDGHPVDEGYDENELFPGSASQEEYNDGTLFCAALTYGPDGDLITAGGTVYYNEPALNDQYGVIELEGAKYTRTFLPDDNTWVRDGDMNWGRWYPTLVPQADGNVLVASGVSKLMKTFYTDGRPVTDNQRNVPYLETFDVESREWTQLDSSADRTLPLYPRMHLLPNGHTYYNAAGQVFNPNGQAYDEILWNLAASFDPETQEWSDLGIPGMGTPAPGFRGSTTSIMLPLAPDDDGTYTQARFLTAGGILGTTPGTYFATADSRVDTVDTTDMSLSSESTGSLNTPRWYGNAVLLPTGEVMIFSGASADEVVGPGSAIPVTVPELWDPETGEWTPMAEASEQRTYHNSAALLADGTVLVGGHDPISTLYGNNTTLIPGTTTPQETRNPTLEVFEPPYLHRGERPTITSAPDTAPLGATLTLGLDIPGSEVESVVLMRKTAITHLIDGGQRAVELPITNANGNKVQVRMPTQAAVVPDGPYLLFVNRSTDEGPVPSEAAEVVVAGSRAVAPGQAKEAATAPKTTELSAAELRTLLTAETDLEAAGAVPIAGDLAFHEAEELEAIALPSALRDGHGHVHLADGTVVSAMGAGGDGSPATTPERLPWLVLATGLVALTAELGRRGLAPARHH